MITAIPTPMTLIYIRTLLASTPNSNSSILRGRSRGVYGFVFAAAIKRERRIND